MTLCTLLLHNKITFYQAVGDDAPANSLVQFIGYFIAQRWAGDLGGRAESAAIVRELFITLNDMTVEFDDVRYSANR